jgi:hypothetical protein
MPINAVPERDPMPVQGVGVATPPWLEFFRGVFFALFGFKRTFTATANLDFGLIAGGGEASLTITVTGARAGDAVIVTPASKTAGIIDHFGIVTTIDTVTVYATNITGGGINPPAKDFRCIVFQQ